MKKNYSVHATFTSCIKKHVSVELLDKDRNVVLIDEVDVCSWKCMLSQTISNTHARHLICLSQWNMQNCLQNKAPQYMMDCCTCTSYVSSRQQHLRSAISHQFSMTPLQHVWLLFPLRVPWNRTHFQTLSGTLLGVLMSSDWLQKLIFLRRIRRLVH